MPSVLERIKNHRFFWLGALVITLALIIGPLLIFLPRQAGQADTPQAHLPVRIAHTDHSSLMTGPYASGQEVTRACLECHPDSATEVMGTVHWTWESQPVQLESRPQPVTVGKKNSINNFCIGIQSNWAGCTSCHAGYGWADAAFDFSAADNVDCLVCHEQSGVYAKTKAGQPADGVDLAVAAKSVAWPTRENCGSCHFNGGGGNAVKHGDLDQELYFPDESLDVHMGGENDMVCTDCHTTEHHQIRGRSISVSLELDNQAMCSDCHAGAPHSDERINTHLQSVACQTCHIPAYGRGDPTKIDWDWSTAGEDRAESQHEYLKIKGSFVYGSDVTPEYFWYSGISDRYLLGDAMDPSQPTLINTLRGSISDPRAKIFPFKVHRAKQPYDTVNKILLQPRTAGDGGFWTTFDWQSALELGSQDAGLSFSGEYGFAETWMYWPITHTVAPASQALQCAACHSDNGRLDWQALGYPGDPSEWGGRSTDATAQAGGVE